MQYAFILFKTFHNPITCYKVSPYFQKWICLCSPFEIHTAIRNWPLFWICLFKHFEYNFYLFFLKEIPIFIKTKLLYVVITLSYVARFNIKSKVVAAILEKFSILKKSFFFILLSTIYNLGCLKKTRKIHSKCWVLKDLYLLFWTNKTFVKRSFVTTQIINSNYEIKFTLTSRFLAPK